MLRKFRLAYEQLRSARVKTVVSIIIFHSYELKRFPTGTKRTFFIIARINTFNLEKKWSRAVINIIKIRNAEFYKLKLLNRL